MRTQSIAAILALAIPLAAVAQFDNGGGAARAGNVWDSMLKNKSKTMTLSFRNANIDMVLEAFSRASGITIIKDPSVKDALTLTTPKPIRISEAFSILNLALKQRNFELRKEGNVLVAGPRRQE
ncbi:MAG: hypothetical protein ABUL72_03120, partial [Armatimonadota bacterium]